MPRIQSRTQGLCRLLSAPAGNSTFPTLSLRIFPHVLGPLPRLLLWCTYPLLPTRHRPSQRYDPVGAVAFATMAFTRTAISVRHSFRGCSHSLMFRPVSLLATPIAPTAGSRHSGFLQSSLRVRCVSHRFRFGPQSDSHSTLHDSSNPPGSRGFYFRAYLSLLPPRAADILTVRFGQLTVEGLAPS